jgi:hypothetical protein
MKQHWRLGKGLMRWMLGAILVTATANAQLTMQEGKLPEDMVKEVLIGKGILAKNVRLTGMAAALGAFSYPEASSFFNSGIILSTGKASDMAGPNDNPKTSTVNGSAGDKNLYSIAGGRTFDGAILEFDFMADKDSVTLNFLFASEEYNDYVGSSFNDAFAVVISGPGMPAKNFAVLPGTTTPITVNSINANQNRQYYVDNNPFTLVGKVNEQVKANLNQDILRNFSFDGRTKVFSAGCRVTPKQVYHLQVAISDAGDGTVDSAVLLEGESFSSQEQYKHVLRRMQIAEKRRQDSLVHVKAVEDSIRIATELQMLRDKVRQDSIANAKRMQEDSLRAQREEEVIPEPVKKITFSDGELEEDDETAWTETEGGDEDEEPSTEPNTFPNIKDAVAFEGEAYMLPPGIETKLNKYGKMLQANPSYKMGIYLPDGDPEDILDMRYDMIRLEVIKGGAKPGQVFRNGFSHGQATTDEHRAEIWIRGE